MDNTKKVQRWLSQLVRCHDQGQVIVAQVGQGDHSPAFLAHCHERLEFFAARQKVLTARMRRLERQVTAEVADMRKELLDKIHAAVKQHGQVVLKRTDEDGVQIDILPAEKTKSS
jgi:hypothetical protein